MSLFNDGTHAPRIKSGYGSATKARETLRRLKGMPRAYQSQIVTTMYHRAKYHKYQTKGMREAMRVYKKYLQTRKYPKRA